MLSMSLAVAPELGNPDADSGQENAARGQESQGPQLVLCYLGWWPGAWLGFSESLFVASSRRLG